MRAVTQRRFMYWVYVGKTHPINTILFVIAGVLLVYGVLIPSTSHLVVAVAMFLASLGLIYVGRKSRSG